MFCRSELKFIRKFVVIVGLQITSILALWLIARYILIMVYAALGGDVLPEPVRKSTFFCTNYLFSLRKKRFLKYSSTRRIYAMIMIIDSSCAELILLYYTICTLFRKINDQILKWANYISNINLMKHSRVFHVCILLVTNSVIRSFSYTILKFMNNVY